jgi:hypothetical protein
LVSAPRRRVPWGAARGAPTPVSGASTWRGTAIEWGDLWVAIEAHCVCAYDLMGTNQTMCTAHLMLTDQSILDHLVHVRRLRSWFVRNEACAAWPCSSAEWSGRHEDACRGADGRPADTLPTDYVQPHIRDHALSTT